MADNILSPFLQSAVQALLSARLTKGGNMQSLAKRRLEHAQRRIVGKLAEGVRKPIKHSTKNIGITVPDQTLFVVRHGFYVPAQKHLLPSPSPCSSPCLKARMNICMPAVTVIQLFFITLRVILAFLMYNRVNKTTI
jgi:hypothetical protein